MELQLSDDGVLWSRYLDDFGGGQQVSAWTIGCALAFACGVVKQKQGVHSVLAALTRATARCWCRGKKGGSSVCR